MIISASAGIGKTTLANKRIDIIDLDLKTFCFGSPTRFHDYCETAIALSNQGYTVLVGCQKNTIKYLLDKNIDYKIIYFAKGLKEFLLDKLKSRAKLSNRSDDYAAYNNADKRYDIRYSFLRTIDQSKII